MAENTKNPPDQDPRQRTPQGDPNKPQKPGSPGPSVGTPDRNQTGGATPGKPGREMDPDRDRVGKPMPDAGKPIPGAGKKDGSIDVDDDDDEMPATPGRKQP